MINLLSMLSGKNTYLAALGIAITAVSGFVTGQYTLLEMLTQMLAGYGLAGYRFALSKK